MISKYILLSYLAISGLAFMALGLWISWDFWPEFYRLGNLPNAIFDEKKWVLLMALTGTFLLLSGLLFLYMAIHRRFKEQDQP